MKKYDVVLMFSAEPFGLSQIGQSAFARIEQMHAFFILGPR